MSTKNQLMAVLVQATVMALLAGCAASPWMNAGDIPPPLRVPTNAVLTLRVHAAGVQIYRCGAAKDDAARFEWLLKEPEAELFDQAGQEMQEGTAQVRTWEAMQTEARWFPAKLLHAPIAPIRMPSPGCC